MWIVVGILFIALVGLIWYMISLPMNPQDIRTIKALMARQSDDPSTEISYPELRRRMQRERKEYGSSSPLVNHFYHCDSGSSSSSSDSGSSGSGGGSSD